MNLPGFNTSKEPLGLHIQFIIVSTRETTCNIDHVGLAALRNIINKVTRLPTLANQNEAIVTVAIIVAPTSATQEKLIKKTQEYKLLHILQLYMSS